ncbi:MAG: type II toxin-antitoxin system prevent-host-death family antitoxin [Methylotetracoccus sp.]|jgi:antitoxin (DNA-binding transcriptional repressor) of toxin-antitoxin stability system|nr:type II toxin-antitoxin system prevent-host-death family antitoxin [Methylotetracoccus sp.]
MRESLGRLDDLVRTEGDIVVTRRGVPIARLLPVAGGLARPSHDDLRAAMTKLDTPREVLVRQDRDQR